MPIKPPIYSPPPPTTTRNVPTEAVRLLSVCGRGQGGGISVFLQWAGWLPARGKGSLRLAPQTCCRVSTFLQPPSSPSGPHFYPPELPLGLDFGDEPDPFLHLSPGSSYP